MTTAVLPTGARCIQCSIGRGEVAKRKANAAVWLLVLTSGLSELACDRCAVMACKNGGAFAIALHTSVMTAVTIDE